MAVVILHVNKICMYKNNNNIINIELCQTEYIFNIIY